MPPVVLPILPLILLAIFIGCVLDPQLEKRIETSLSGIGSSVLSGPVNTAVNAWIKVAVIGAGLVLGVWVLETKIARKEGMTPAEAGVTAPNARDVVQQGPIIQPSGGVSAGSRGVSAEGGFKRTLPLVLPVKVTTYKRSPGIGRRHAA